MKEEIPAKLFFSIGEVSKLTNVPAYVLRYWENEFSQLRPEKGRTGQRKYRKKDIEIILKIKELLYDKLYTIAGAKNELNNIINRSKDKKRSKDLDFQYLKKELQEILEILS